MDGNETQPIIGVMPNDVTPSKRIRNCVASVFCDPNLKWLCLAILLLARLVGLTMFTVWAADCFFREFHTTPTCEHFLLFPSPERFEISWLSMCIAVSLFLIFHVCCRSPTFPGTIATLRHLRSKKYFYKITLVLFSVCIYDFVVMRDQPTTIKTISYSFFMIEKILLVILMFLLNFLPRFCKGDVKLQWLLYKLALGMYSLDSYVLALLGSTIAVYKVVTVATPQTINHDAKPDTKSVVALMLLITNNGLRYFTGDFFLSKIFDENVDILGGATAKTKLTEIIGVQEDRAVVNARLEVGLTSRAVVARLTQNL